MCRQGRGEEVGDPQVHPVEQDVHSAQLEAGGGVRGGLGGADKRVLDDLDRHSHVFSLVGRSGWVGGRACGVRGKEGCEWVWDIQVLRGQPAKCNTQGQSGGTAFSRSRKQNSDFGATPVAPRTNQHTPDDVGDPWVAGLAALDACTKCGHPPPRLCSVQGTRGWVGGWVIGWVRRRDMGQATQSQSHHRRPPRNIPTHAHAVRERGRHPPTHPPHPTTPTGSAMVVPRQPALVTFYIVRHGESTGNRDGVLQGQVCSQFCIDR